MFTVFQITLRRVLVWVLLGALFFVVIQYLPVMFYAWEFDGFVRDEVRFAPLRETTEQVHIVDHVLAQARNYQLLLDKKDVQVIKTRDSERGINILTVDVRYRANVDLYYFNHEVPFHISATTFY